MNKNHQNKIERLLDGILSEQPALSISDTFSLFMKIPTLKFSCQLASELFTDTQISHFEDKTVLEIRVDEDVFRVFECSDMTSPVLIYKNDQYLHCFADQVSSIGHFVEELQRLNVQLYFKEFFHFNDEVRADLVKICSESIPESIVNF